MRRLHKGWPPRHLHSHHPRQKVCRSAHLRAVRQRLIQVQPLRLRQAALQCWLLVGPAVEQRLLCQWQHGYQLAHCGQGTLAGHLRGGRPLHLQEGLVCQCSAGVLPS